MTVATTPLGRAAVVLGASGGLGSACCRSLAARGFDIHGVHLDTSERRDELLELERDITALGVRARFSNLNAVRSKTLSTIIAELEADGAPVGVLVHALAFGSLGPLVPLVPRVNAAAERTSEDLPVLTPAQLESTMNVMAHSLVHWVQALHAARLFARGAHVLALTSIGALRVLAHYGAVSAAKAALEAYARQLAVELAPDEIAVNCIRVGVVDTPALRRIPGSQAIVDRVRRTSPHARLTQATELGEFVAAVVGSVSHWTTGSVIAFDGGESLTT